MLSLGRKYVSEGLGFGVGGEMEETEREEGEAYFQDENDAQLSSLSYIEERLQDVLGHLQKDFEGEVSAENLGAKFGGYGSFLPTYQRSPAILSQPRTPPKVQSHNPPRSPNNPPPEDTHQDLKIPPNASHSRSARTESTPFYAENSSKRDMHLSTAQAAEDPISKHASMSKSVSATDQKSLKVRIKVGSDNVSARKNAAIYSGLGLDISPSSSFEDSPVGSGVLSPDYGAAPHESPLSILQVMSSPSVSGCYLLSPLAENLMLLTEKPCMKDSKSWNVQKGIQASPPMLTNEHVPVMDIEVFRETKMKFIDKVRQPMEARNANRKSVGNDMSNLLEKGNEAETLVDGELFPKASKSPLPSHSKSSVERLDRQINGDKERGNDRASGLTKELNKGMVKDVAFSSDLVKGETSDNGGNELVPFNGHPNSKKHSADTARKDKKASSYKDVLFDTVKDDESKGDKRTNNLKDDSDEFKGMTGQNSGSVEPPRQKAAQKAVLYEKDEGKMPKEKESKKKSKSNQSNGVGPTEFPPKESAAVGSLATSKDKKKSSKDRDPFSVNKNYATKSHDSSMTYSKELGGIATEQDDNRMVTLEMHLKDNLNDSKLKIEGEAHVSAEKSKEKLCGKKVESLTISKEAKTQDAMPLTGNGLTSNAVTAPVDPFLIKENWVACDRCQKWRLLPFGMNPDHLPKKWLCSMLTWLPGMNKCTFSEEETTNALYQMAVPEGQHNLQSQCSAAGSGVTLADAQHLDQSHELSSHALPSGGKRKHGLKDPSNSLCHSTQNSIEKNQQVCTKKSSVNDVNQLPVESHMVGRVAYQHLSKSNDIAVENHRHRQKEKDKHKLLERSSDGGNHIEQSRKHSKSKNKRADNQDGFRTTKKIKAEDFHYTEDGAWHSSQDVIEKVVPNLAGSLLTKASGKKKQKHNSYISSEEFKGDTWDKLPESRKKLKGQVQVPLDGEYKTQIGSSDFAMKKRKVKEWQEHQVSSENLPFSGHVSDNIASVKEISETELRKKKKSRLLKPEGKEYSASMKDGKLDKKSNVVRSILSGTGNKDPLGDGRGRVGGMNDHQLGQHEVSAVNQQAMDGDDSLKRDLGCGQPSTAATSSSSKVSGSHKSKLNFQVKSSPVESVSSSPLKICNTDNLTTARSNVLGKNDGANVGFFVMGSPRQVSDFEGDDLIDRSGMTRKEKSSSIVQHASVKSQKVEELSVPYQGRGANRISSREAKDGMISKAYDGMCSDPLYSDYGNVNVMNGSASTSDQHNPYLGKVHDHEHDSEKSNNHNSTNGSSMQKSGKSSSRSRERRKNAKTDLDKVKVKVSECFSEQEELYPMTNDGSNRLEAGIDPRDFSPFHEDLRDGKYNYCKNSVVESDKDEKSYIGRKGLMADLFGDVKMDGDSKTGILETSDYPLLNKQHTGPSSKGGKSGIDYSKDRKLSLQRKPRQVTYDDEKPMNRLLSESADPAEMASDKGKLLPNGPSGDKQEIKTRHPHSMPMLQKNSRSDVLPVDASSSDAVKEKKQPRKPNSQNVVRNSSRHSTPNGGSVGRDLNAPSPVKKDSGQAAAMLREAKDLKHSADRLVNGGLERTGLYFQAALKFLQGASLLEPCNVESAKHGETTQSMKVYIDTVKLCEFCAHEYEKCKEMAAAALAYKCIEVAHMRVIYSKQYIVGKDRHELQSLLQVAPLGESPPSSVSDIDNLNNQATLEKAGLAKGTNSSQAAGNLVISPRNRPSMQRLLQYVNHMDSAIEALKKSRNALAAANASAEEARYGTEGILSVRRVLEFNFHDVESLLRLVRLALEVINT